MRKVIVAAVAAGALLVAVPSAAVPAPKEPESCFALNPAQSTCSFTVTSVSSSGTVTGAVGAGDWIVVVKRGKQKLTIKPPSAEPAPVSFAYQEGDKVTATVKSAGGWVLAGHD